YGLQRHYGGGMAVRTITCLPALVGAWRDHGGGIQLSSSGLFRHLEKSGLYAEGGEERPIVNGQWSMADGEDAASPLAPHPLPLATPRTINMNRLGDALSLDPAVLARAHYRPRPVDRMPAPEDAGPPVMALIVYNSNP